MEAGEIILRYLSEGTARNLTDGMWHVSLLEAISGLSDEQASWRPSPQQKSIHEHVCHLILWRKELAHVLSGGPRTEELYEDEQASWPQALASWQNTIATLISTQKELEAAVKTFDLLQQTPPTEWATKNLLGNLAHDSYHCARIISLRQAQGTWPPKAR